MEGKVDDALQRRIDRTMQIVEEKHPEGLHAAQERMDQDLNMTCSDGGLRDKNKGFVKWTRELPDLQKPQMNIEHKHALPDKPSHEKMSLDHQSRVLGERRQSKSREIERPEDLGEDSDRQQLRDIDREKILESQRASKDDQSGNYLERTLDEDQLKKEKDLDQKEEGEQEEGEEKEEDQGEGEQKDQGEGGQQTWGEMLGQKAQQLTDKGIAAASNVLNIPKQTVEGQLEKVMDKGTEQKSDQQDQEKDQGQEQEKEEPRTWGQAVGEKVQQITDKGVELATNVLPLQKGGQEGQEGEQGEGEQPRTWTQSITGTVQQMAEKGAGIVSGMMGNQTEQSGDQTQLSKEDIRDKTEQVVQKGKEKAGEVAKDVQEKLPQQDTSDLKEQSVGLLQQALDKGKEVAGQVISGVQAHLPEQITSMLPQQGEQVQQDQGEGVQEEGQEGEHVEGKQRKHRNRHRRTKSQEGVEEMKQKGQELVDKGKVAAGQALEKVQQNLPETEVIGDKVRNIIEQTKEEAGKVASGTHESLPGIPSLSQPITSPGKGRKHRNRNRRGQSREGEEQQGQEMTEQVGQKAQEIVNKGKEVASQIGSEVQARLPEQSESTSGQIPPAQVARIKNSQRHHGRKSREGEDVQQPSIQEGVTQKAQEWVDKGKEMVGGVVSKVQENLPQMGSINTQQVGEKVQQVVQSGKEMAGQAVSQIQANLPEMPVLSSQPTQSPGQEHKGRRHRNRGKKGQSREGEEPLQQEQTPMLTERLAQAGQTVLDKGIEMAGQIVGTVQSQLPQDKPLTQQGEQGQNLQQEGQEQGKGGRRHRHRGRRGQSHEDIGPDSQAVLDSAQQKGQELLQKGQELGTQAMSKIQSNLPQQGELVQGEQGQSKGNRHRHRGGRRGRSQEGESSNISEEVRDKSQQLVDKGKNLAGQVAEKVQQNMPEQEQIGTPSQEEKLTEPEVQTWSQALGDKVQQIAEKGITLVDSVLRPGESSGEGEQKDQEQLPEDIDEDKQPQTWGEALADKAQQLREKGMGLVSNILPAALLPAQEESVEQPTESSLQQGSGDISTDITTDITEQPKEVFDEVPLDKDLLVVDVEQGGGASGAGDILQEALVDVPKEGDVTIGGGEVVHTWGEAVGGKVQQITEKGKDLVGSMLQRAQNMADPSRSQQ